MRVWEKPEEPDDVELVRDREGDLWQRCRDYHWQAVETYQEAGLPRIGEASWQTILQYGPLTEVDPDA